MIHIDRQVKARDIVYELSELFVERGAPDYLRSDNGSEFTAQTVRGWLQWLGVKTLFIEPGSPWENGYIESFNGNLRDELLNGEILDTILEARVVTEQRRKEYNTSGRTTHWVIGHGHRKHTSCVRLPMADSRKKLTQYWHHYRGLVTLLLIIEGLCIDLRTWGKSPADTLDGH